MHLGNIAFNMDLFLMTFWEIITSSSWILTISCFEWLIIYLSTRISLQFYRNFYLFLFAILSFNSFSRSFLFTDAGSSKFLCLKYPTLDAFLRLFWLFFLSIFNYSISFYILFFNYLLSSRRFVIYGFFLSPLSSFLTFSILYLYCSYTDLLFPSGFSFFFLFSNF